MGDYLDSDPPAGPPDVSSAAEYFVTLLGAVTDDDHRAIRERGAAVAALGHRELCRVLGERIERLEDQFASLDANRLLTVAGGLVMRLDDYLATRIVEQVVHLDDLSRSVSDRSGNRSFMAPAAGAHLAIDVGIEMLLQQCGSAAAVRAIFRDGFAESAFPVL